jgi:hypothetical protein
VMIWGQMKKQAHWVPGPSLGATKPLREKGTKRRR